MANAACTLALGAHTTNISMSRTKGNQNRGRTFAGQQVNSRDFGCDMPAATMMAGLDVGGTTSTGLQCTHNVGQIRGIHSS
jgi:hypothetical protein